MEGLEDKLCAILNNPESMQQIMAMAQSLGGSRQSEAPAKEPPPQPDFDISMIQKMSGLVNQTGTDKNQQALLRALAPYLSHQRISKLENAMRAAKMARFAAAALSNRSQQGR